MNRCDFSSISTCLKNHISESNQMSQPDFLYELFEDFMDDPANQDFSMDNGLVCRWLTGQAKISPKISAYYSKPSNQKKLAETIHQNLLPLMSDCNMAMQDIYTLFIQDDTISDAKKKNLASLYKPASSRLLFLAKLISFGMERQFIKRDTKNQKLLAGGALSPIVLDYIMDSEVPKPCRHFIGRDKELEELYTMLEENRHVFPCGIAGIGKSELAKAYAKRYIKHYTNILYVEYTPLRKLDGIDWGQRLLDEKAPAMDRVLYSYWGGKTSVRIPYYLLDAEGYLYKTDIDREQRKDVSDKEPEIYERMKRYSNWFKDELLADFPKKDTRPFIIGHPQETYSKLPARDARISGPIERSNRYPNCSYFTNWKSPEAEISWNVEVEESGLFEAFIYYTCDKRNIGSTFELRTDRDAENLVFTLDQVNDQPMLGADLDRVLREESYVKGFAPCSVGTIPLSKGTATLSLQAKTIRNEEAMNFWMLVLKRVK